MLAIVALVVVRVSWLVYRFGEGWMRNDRLDGNLQVRDQKLVRHGIVKAWTTGAR